MILVDVNLLVYARLAGTPQHEAAREWLDARLNAPEPVGVPWPVSVGFLRIATHPRIFAKPLGLDAAWTQVREWLSLPAVWTPEPTERHAEVFALTLRDAGRGADLVSDAHLAALAIEHGLELCSTDRDFARFEGLRWRDPLREPR